MPKYLFTSDQRISSLAERIKWVADYIDKGNSVSDITDKSDNNNATTLKFYYNLQSGTETCKTAVTNPQVVIRNFILKFQFPNTRTIQSYNDSIIEKCFLAPFRVVITTLYLMAKGKENDISYLSLNEILYYIFCDKHVCQNPRFSYNYLISRIKTGRQTYTNDELYNKIENIIEWKQHTRQCRELMQVLNYAFYSIKYKDGKVSFSLNHPDYIKDEGFIQEVINYNKIWYPSQINNFTLAEKEYISYMDTVNTPYSVIEVSITHELEKSSNLSKQVVFYGAPGTGKSHSIEVATEGEDVIRTTFHPDSDYSTFVGAYKPTTKEIPMRDVTGKVIIENGKLVTENRIVYEFVNQAFLQAYVDAWKKFAENQTEPKRQYLVIEEINRGNCAQIFGDLFQLLDRNTAGFSEYPIKADADMKKQLKKQLDGLVIDSPYVINALYKGKDIVGQVLDGDILLLPNNLYIWATMNTSDQSLFPIDSAFKRRWDWRYVRIDDAGKNWKITVNGKNYDWWDFLEKINALVGETTSSEDKKLGYFFCKAANGKISSDTFVSKVIFYLWNDVFKDYEFDGDVFNDEPIEGKTSKLSFDKFYLTDATGKTVVNESKVDLFLSNLKVSFVDDGSEETNVGQDVESNETKRGVAHRQLLAVTFPDGTKFDVDDGLTHFAVYFEAIKKIGVEQAEQIAAASKYHRFNRPIISKERYPEIESSDLSYVQVDDYFIVKGVSEDTYINILNLCSEQLNLNLDVKFKQ